MRLLEKEAWRRAYLSPEEVNDFASYALSPVVLFLLEWVKYLSELSSPKKTSLLDRGPNASKTFGDFKKM